MKKFATPDGAIGKTTIKPGMNVERAVARLYSEGRSVAGDPKLPSGRNSTADFLQTGDRLETRQGARDNIQRNQTPDNAHGQNYDSETKGWVRGAPMRMPPPG
jgi:hypothetical protein